MEEVKILKLNLEEDDFNGEEDIEGENEIHIDGFLDYENATRCLDFDEPEIQNFDDEIANCRSAMQSNLRKLGDILQQIPDDDNAQKIQGRKDRLLEQIQNYETAKRELGSLLEEQQALSRSILEIRDKKSETHKIFKSLQSELSRVKNKHRSILDRVEAAERESEKRMSRESIDALSKELELTSKWLGVSVTKNGDYTSVIISFLHLDERDPERKFKCEITIQGSGDGRTYQILKCDPPVENLGRLEEILNKTGEFHGFMVKLREGFKSIL